MHSRHREQEAAPALDSGSLSVPRKQASHRTNLDPSRRASRRDGGTWKILTQDVGRVHRVGEPD